MLTQAKTAQLELADIPIVGKLKYMAPEIHKLIAALKDRQKSKDMEIVYDPEKADVFSLGVLLTSLGCLDAVDGQAGQAALDKQLSQLQEHYPKLHQLVVDMLHPDPGLRKNLTKLYEKLCTYSNEMTKLPFCELEFVSELKTTDENGTGSFDKAYIMWVTKGESNMKNNLFGEAIACFLKVYEMIKRGNMPFNKE